MPICVVSCVVRPQTRQPKIYRHIYIALTYSSTSLTHNSWSPIVARRRVDVQNNASNLRPPVTPPITPPPFLASREGISNGKYRIFQSRTNTYDRRARLFSWHPINILIELTQHSRVGKSTRICHPAMFLSKAAEARGRLLALGLCIILPHSEGGWT